MIKKQQKIIKIKNKVTIEKLVQITAKGFLEVNKRFRETDKKIDAMDVKFESKLEKMDKKIDAMDVKFESKLEKMDKKIDAMDVKFESKLEKMDKKIDKMLSVADHICGEISDWRDENAIGAAKDFELQKQLENHEKRIIQIEQKANV